MDVRCGVEITHFKSEAFFTDIYRTHPVFSNSAFPNAEFGENAVEWLRFLKYVARYGVDFFYPEFQDPFFRRFLKSHPDLNSF
jgi:hypothetical protein